MKGLLAYCLLVSFLVPLGNATAQKAKVPAAQKLRTDLEKRVRSLLESERLEDQAWGAYYAGKYGLSGLTPWLWSLVDTKQQEKKAPLELSVQCALIDLGAPANAEQFKLLMKRNWQMCALQAALQQESGEQLFALMRKAERTEVWIAACNGLLNLRHADLSKELLSDITIALNVHVWDGFGALSPVHGIAHGDGVICVPKGYPPIVAYTLHTIHPDKGDILLSPGPTNVYLRRREKAGPQMGTGFGRFDFDLAQYKLTCLYDLANDYMLAKKDKLKTKATLNVQWQNLKAFESTLKERSEQMKSKWNQLKASLVKEKLLAQKDSDALALKVSIKLSDHRERKTPKLPDSEAIQGKYFGK